MIPAAVCVIASVFASFCVGMASPSRCENCKMKSDQLWANAIAVLAMWFSATWLAVQVLSQ